jgi:hypothetical protein
LAGTWLRIPLFLAGAWMLLLSRHSSRRVMLAMGCMLVSVAVPANLIVARMSGTPMTGQVSPVFIFLAHMVGLALPFLAVAIVVPFQGQIMRGYAAVAVGSIPYVIGTVGLIVSPSLAGTPFGSLWSWGETIMVVGAVVLAYDVARALSGKATQAALDGTPA